MLVSLIILKLKMIHAYIVEMKNMEGLLVINVNMKKIKMVMN